MPDKLREFIYLDEVSVNSHLSSLGEAKPTEIVEQTEKTKETGGGGDVKILKGEHRRGSTDSTETVMSATAPYRFERLREKLEEEEIPIHDNPDPRAVGRGDVVRISGKCSPMSIFKMEIAALALLDLVDEETAESVSESEFVEEDSEENEQDYAKERREDDEEVDITTLHDAGELFLDLAESLIGENVPVRIDYKDENEENQSCMASLSRERFNIDIMNAFLEDKRYVVFGRVDESVSEGDSWDPVKATNVLGRYFEEELNPEASRDDWREAAENIGIEMQGEDLVLEGRSLVIHPIAMYW